jgi:hypothetical protein
LLLEIEGRAIDCKLSEQALLRGCDPELFLRIHDRCTVRVCHELEWANGLVLPCNLSKFTLTV